MAEKETFYAKDREEWRKWLKENHALKKNIWLLMYKKESKTPSVYYEEAVEEALCFGWIDSTPNKRDEQSFIQLFAQRKPKSNWSKVNKERIAKLLETGKIEAAGLKAIEVAKENGSWTALDEVEQLILPEDLRAALKQYPKAEAYFEAFPRSVKRGILEWIMNAKQDDTRSKRIQETARLAEQNERANQYKKK